MRRAIGLATAAALAAALLPLPAWAQVAEAVGVEAAPRVAAPLALPSVPAAGVFSAAASISAAIAPALSAVPSVAAPAAAGASAAAASPIAAAPAAPAQASLETSVAASAARIPAAAPAAVAPASLPSPASAVRAAAPALRSASGLAAAADSDSPEADAGAALDRFYSGSASRAPLARVSGRFLFASASEPGLPSPHSAHPSAPSPAPLGKPAAAPQPAPAAAPAPVPAAAAASEIPGAGLWRGLWAKAKSLIHVLPDPARNRAFWSYTIGQAFVTLGANFGYTALPGLIATKKSDTSKLSENRAVNWGSQAASSLITGPLVDRQPVKRTMVWAYLGRGALMAAVPILFVTGHFGFAAFSLIIGMAGFLQATTTNAASVAFNRILGDDDAYYNRANAISTIVTDAVGVIAPLMAGGFIAWIATMFKTPLMGNALAYGVFSVMLLLTVLLYARSLVIPSDAGLEARRALMAELKGADLGGAKVKGVSMGEVDGKPVLIVEVAGVDPAAVKGLPADFQGYPVRAQAARSAVREMIAGFRVILADPFLRLYLIATTISTASGDALSFAVLTRYLDDVLHAGAGAFGVFLAASSLGLALASAAMTLVKDPAQSALAPAARELRLELARARPDLDEGSLNRAAAALRGAPAEVLERYKAQWEKSPELVKDAASLAADVDAQAAVDLAAALKVSAAQASALLEAAGTPVDVRRWAERGGAKLLAQARADAKTGMDSLQRQGRFGAYALAVSWVAYAAMFFAGSMPLSIGLMLVSSFLSGPQSILWSSLTTRVIQGSYPQDQGKIYSAMSFYWLACSVAGSLLFGWMLTALSTPTALLVTAGVLAACAVSSVFLARRSFPLKR